jgi:hypothetical protein
MAVGKLVHHLQRFVTLMLLVALMPAAELVAARSSPASAAPASPDAQFFDLLNQYRTSKGLAPLVRDGGLDSVAQQWSAQMASVFAANGGVVIDPAAPKDCTRTALCHHPDLAQAVTAVAPAWTGAAENLAVGTDVVAMHNSLVADPPHEANMTGPYNRVGIGVTVTSDHILGDVRLPRRADRARHTDPRGGRRSQQCTVAAAGRCHQHR